MTERRALDRFGAVDLGVVAPRLGLAHEAPQAEEVVDAADHRDRHRHVDERVDPRRRGRRSRSGEDAATCTTVLAFPQPVRGDHDALLRRGHARAVTATRGR